MPSDASLAPVIAGYRTYWRLTMSPEWNHSVYAGDASEQTLENAITDNGLFGVVSVSK
jgi:hypothetical protein